jgi:hypothetical protein
MNIENSIDTENLITKVILQVDPLFKNDEPKN